MRAMRQIAGLTSATCAHVLALRAGAFVIEDGTAFARPVAPASALWRSYQVLELCRAISSFESDQNIDDAFRLQ